MTLLMDFNADWRFEGAERVTLPHNALDIPYAYFDETSYQRTFTYDKTFVYDPSWAGQEVFVVFDGAMANTEVKLNGEVIATHADGYTPFEARLTAKLKTGHNTITVKVDGSENPEIPPFGGMIDYLTYAGIYRDVWLKVTPPVSIGSVKIETPDALEPQKSVLAKIWLSNPQSVELSGTLKAVLRDASGAQMAETSVEATSDALEIGFAGLEDIRLWDVKNPALYKLDLKLETQSGTHTYAQRFGFRKVEFTTEGFWLNGQKLKLRGLNRHQSFPYVGYALGKAAQVKDAEILKNELRVNLVRTSHYPQSTYFLDRCDELGLLVFEEIPGWQHIGGDTWKAEAVENVRRMITRDWNHPSIILWGVRINESRDDHDFYTETNRLAHELDTTRQTGGVRCITHSELLEDVYTMNDFNLGMEEWEGGERRPLRDQQTVTGLNHIVPYMVTEFNGHMYPTKTFDQEQRQAEHVHRHLQMLDAGYGSDEVAGVIGWCAFDYNTHKDFGSGDRICHHGVMDMFREPKFAAYAWASQSDVDEGAILQPVTYWSRGERNIGGILPLIVLTNCDEVEFQYGDNPPKRVGPDRENYPNLPHPPVVFDNRHLTPEEIGAWGWDWKIGKISGYVNGQKVIEKTFAPDAVPTTLEIAPDANTIALRDPLRVMIRVLDQAGNKIPFLFDPVKIEIGGPADLYGPQMVPVRGGSTGFWLRSTGKGVITIKVSHDRIGTQTIEIRSE